jgi:MFS family permease
MRRHVLTSAIGSTGLAAGGTAGALLAAQLAGTKAAAGLPLGLLVLGSAAAAVLVSWLAKRIGRSASLAAGYGLGAAGAVVVVVAAVAGSLATLLAGSLLVGAANSAIFLTRYAAAELAVDAARGRAVGLVLSGTAVGAVASPLLLGPAGEIAQELDLPRLSGLYLVAAVAFGACALLLAPLGARPTLAGVVPTRRDLREALRAARVGVAVLAAANFTMVAVMAVVPVHLMAGGERLETIGTMISLHVAGMFAPSPLSGWLADRAGPLAATVLGSTLIAAAGGIGAGVSSMRALTISLVLLGVGWNASVIGASTLIVRAVRPAFRLHVEALGEVAMGVAAAAGAPAAGVVVAVGGFAALAFAGTAIASATLAASAYQVVSA